MTRRRSARVLAAQASPAGLGYYDRGRSFQFPPHLQILDEALCDVAAGRCKRLIVELPPRHGKSMESSEYFPAWFVCRWADRRVILCSYAAKLASDFGGKARDLVIAYGATLFGVEVNPAKSAADDWSIKGRRGGMVTAGVGGGITGKGADVLIIDDPIKNHEEAQSQLHRDKVWDWYTSTAYTRLEPEGAIVIIQTRWHEDDLAGRAQTLQADEDWRVIRMPAICDDPETDPLGRKEGEALWPKRYGVKRLSAIAKAVGSFVWNALYQQRPVAAEGNVLKRAWWKRWNLPGLPTSDAWTSEHATLIVKALKLEGVLQSWDTTFKDTKGSDYVVGQVWGWRGADRFLLFQVRARMDFPRFKREVRALTALWPMATAKLVEDKANGPAAIAEMRDEIEGLIAVDPQGGKVARAIAVSPVVESGNVFLPDESIAPWVVDFVNEASAFPNSAHDDQVDGATQAILRMKSPNIESATNPLEGGPPAPAQRSKRRKERRIEEYFAGDDDPDEDDEDDW